MDRIVLGTAATLRQVFYSDTTAIDADGDVDVTIYDTAGAELTTATAVHEGAVDSGTYKLTFTPTQVDRCSVKWIGTFDGTEQTLWSKVDVVGARYFSLARLRDTFPIVEDVDDFPDTALADARIWAEQRAEEIMGKSFVRQAIKQAVRVPSTSWGVRLKAPLRTIRSVKASGVTTSYTLTGGEYAPYLTNLAVDTDIDVIYEYGHEEVDEPLSWAVMMLATARATRPYSAISNRAERWQPDGASGMWQLAMPGSDRTGLPEVDAILLSRKAFAIA